MTNFLEAQAMQDIWCEPLEDSQYVIAGARVTPPGGASKHARLLWADLELPNAFNIADRSYYHVYQIGQISPSLFNIDFVKGTWYNLETLCMDDNTVVDLYLENGAVLPRSDAWIRQNMDNNIVICVKIVHGFNLGTGSHENPTTHEITIYDVSMDNTQLYARFYTNSILFNAAWRDTTPNPDQAIRTLHATITNANVLAAFRGQVIALEAQYPGVAKGIYFRDGFLVSKPGAFTTDMIGARFTYSFDSTVRELVKYPIATAPSFVSLLDATEQKYLLLQDKRYNIIDYYGDIDFYLIVNLPNGAYKGVYINRALAGVFRMITHNAYSIRGEVIAAYTQMHDWLSNLMSLSVLAVVRAPGKIRPLVNEAVRVEDLYRMDLPEIIEAMTGVNSLVPAWRAEQLEQSAYVQMMSVDYTQITPTLAFNAYGYNAAAVVANQVIQTPVLAGNHKQLIATPSQQIMDLTTGNCRRTIWCYDSGGRLIDWVNNEANAQIIDLPVSMNAAVVCESLPYLTLPTSDGTVFNQMVTSNTDLKQYGFRAYACGMSGTTPVENWSDVTGSALYTYYPNGQPGVSTIPTIAWNTGLLAAQHLFVAVKIGGVIQAFPVPLQTGNYPGFLRFSVDVTAKWQATVVTRPQSIPAGIVDVFMDGYPLVRDIDYYMQWPEIVICKRPTTAPSATKILVRAYGHCNPVDPIAPYMPREIGFASGGLLSVDGAYQTRDDCNIRIIANGAFVTRAQVEFAEGQGTQLIVDGRPYAVTDYVIPIEPFTPLTTVPARTTALTMDTAVANYLTSRMDTTVPQYPHIQGQAWALYSPFCSAIIHAFGDGFLNAGQLDVPYNNLQVDAWIEPYRYLLDYDPCVVGVHGEYTDIFPHPYTTTMQVTQKQWVFLDNIIRNYLNSNTSLTPSVTIG